MTSFITFDASIKDNQLGVGLYDNFTKEKYHILTSIDKNCSMKAESIALGCALQYCIKNNRPQVHLFTDNKMLADQGIPSQYKSLTEEFTEVTLTWIPRELNKDADLASKNAFFPHLKNPSATKLKEMRKKQNAKNIQNIQNIQNTKTGLAKVFETVSIQKKLEMLETLSRTKFEKEIVRMIKTKSPDNYDFQYNKKTSMFMRVAYTLCQGDFSQYSKKRINSAFQKKQITNKTINKEQFKNFLNDRDYLGIKCGI